MAVVIRDARRSKPGGAVFGFGRYRGLGDAASDAILGSSWGAADYAAWQQAVAALPAGYTMGDPTSPLWGKAYYNGVALMSPPDDAATYAAIQQAADLAYKIYSAIDSIRSSTNPYMVAVLLDPEWIAMENSGQPIVWANLSPGLQAKIKLVPNLYNSIIGNLAALDPPTITAGPTVATGPARYVQSGIEFLADGTVVSYNGTPVPSGTMLTPAEVQSLLTTGKLPAGDSGPGGMTVKAPAPVPDAPSAPSSSTVAPAPSSSPAPYTYTPPQSPAVYGPALVNLMPSGQDSTGLVSGGGGGGGGGFSTGPGGGGALPSSSTSSSIFTGRNGLLIAGALGALAFVVLNGKPSSSRRRRRR